MRLHLLLPLLALVSGIFTVLHGTGPAPVEAANGPRVREQVLELVWPGPEGPRYGEISMFAVDDPAADMDARLAEGKAAMLARFPGASEVQTGVTAQYRLFGVRWPQPSASWLYNPEGSTPAMSQESAKAAVMAGSHGWDDVGGTGWHYEFLGETATPTGCNGDTTAYHKDGDNVVGWGHIVGGYLGYSCYWRGTTLVPNTPYFATQEFDIIFEPDNAYSAGTLQALAMHEFGHALGLDHTEPALCPGEAMCAGNAALTFTSPRPDDINGAVALYGIAPTMTPTVPAGKRPYRAIAVAVARD